MGGTAHQPFLSIVARPVGLTGLALLIIGAACGIFNIFAEKFLTQETALWPHAPHAVQSGPRKESMRVLIIGDKGQLGRDLMRVFEADHEVHGCDLPEVDITESEAVRRIVEETEPQWIILSAAYTDVEGAEDHRDEAFRVNEGGTRIVAQAAADAQAALVYYSTDFVFDGTKTDPYEVDDVVNPQSVYGASKLGGERAVQEIIPAHFIIRTAWLYGPGGNNFVEKIINAAKTRDSLKVVEEEVGSPTHTEDVALATKALLATSEFGTYHAVNAGKCSRFQFARRILALAGDDTPVAPCASSEFPTKAERPAYSVLSTRKLEQVCNYKPPSWDTALQRYMARRPSGGD